MDSTHRIIPMPRKGACQPKNSRHKPEEQRRLLSAAWFFSKTIFLPHPLDTLVACNLYMQNGTWTGEKETIAGTLN
jgi:hypothetical protein